MAVQLGDIIIEKFQYGYGEAFDGTPLYILTQLQELNLEVTSDPIEVRDKDGNLVKKIYKSKDGSLSCQNAFINTNLIAASSGSNPVIATEGDAVVMPKMIVVEKGTEADLSDMVSGGVPTVCAMNPNGSMGKVFYLAGSKDAEGNTRGTQGQADADCFAVVEGKLVLPTADVEQFFVEYDRDVTDGIKIQNSINEFPKSHVLKLKAVYFDPCAKDTLLPVYVVIHSFAPNVDVTIPLNTEAQIDFGGSMEVDYCSKDKVLYTLYFPNDIED